MNFKHLEYSDQINQLESRGMKFHDKERAIQTLSYVSYYKIKQFAEPFAKITACKNKPANIEYQNVHFEKVLSRYYQDKNFRQQILHALEDIEVALQTQIAYVLGEKYGDYGYLDFFKWTDRNSNSTEHILKVQEYIKKEIANQIKYNIDSNRDIREKIKFSNGNNYLPVWLGAPQLMFGHLVNMLKIMSKNNLKKISKYFGCTNRELISWMSLLNLIRNIAAHNSNLIDLNIKTPPVTRKEWNKNLNRYKKSVITNKISVVIVIIKHFINQINPKYDFTNISKSMQKLIQGNKHIAISYGFKDEESMQNISPIRKRDYRRTTKRRDI